MLSKEQLEDEVVQKLYTVIEHFKNDNPIGLPIAPIPDPMVKILSDTLHRFTPTFIFIGCARSIIETNRRYDEIEQCQNLWTQKL